MNKLLERQLNKVFGSLDAVPSNIQKILDIISVTYDHAEEDRIMIERSMEISSKEFGELNQRLKRETLELQSKLDELARAEESEKSSREILDAMKEGCEILDPNWRFLYVNDAMAKIARRTKEELMGRTLLEVEPGIENTEVFARFKHCMDTRETQEIETEFKFNDGSTSWFQVNVQPVPRGIFVIASDITVRKGELEELKTRTEEMERLNKMMVDRELKMIKLKQEIFDLKQKIT